MHEMSLIADLLSKILDVARREGSDRVTAVGVELGALSHCSPQHFTEHFNEAARGTIAEGALLEIMTRDDPSHPRAQEIVLTSVEVEEP
ncbi:MAG: hydrogenase maturation nickel metallochaperone HypA [Planctomycetota bacterium]